MASELNQKLENLIFLRKLTLMPDGMDAVSVLDAEITELLYNSSFDVINQLIDGGMKMHMGHIVSLGFLAMVDEYEAQLPSYRKLFQYAKDKGIQFGFTTEQIEEIFNLMELK